MVSEVSGCVLEVAKVQTRKQGGDCDRHIRSLVESMHGMKLLSLYVTVLHCVMMMPGMH